MRPKLREIDIYIIPNYLAMDAVDRQLMYNAYLRSKKTKTVNGVITAPNVVNGIPREILDKHYHAFDKPEFLVHSVDYSKGKAFIEWCSGVEQFPLENFNLCSAFFTDKIDGIFKRGELIGYYLERKHTTI